MPRANLYHLPGYVWHLNARCHRQQGLLRFARDRRAWLHWLYEARQRFALPWGSTNLSFEPSHYFDDPSKYRLTLFGSAEVRLFKGLSFNVFGDIERIRDQIYLPRGAATDEEILVRQRQLQTSYSYWVGFGISYSFGSKYQNVVNRRFGGSSGGMIIMF